MQIARPLHENGTSRSNAQSGQRRRAKPRDSTPQRRNFRNSLTHGRLLRNHALHAQSPRRPALRAADRWLTAMLADINMAGELKLSRIAE
jgi:hypothetical protein